MNKRTLREVLFLLGCQALCAAATYAGGHSELGWLWISFTLLPIYGLLARTHSLWGGAFIGWLQAAIFVNTTLSWLPSTLGSYFDLSRATSIFLVGLLCWIFEPQFIAAGVFRVWLSRVAPPESWLRFFGPALFWVSSEALIPRFFTDTLSYPLLNQPALAQVADLSGTHGLTFLVSLFAEWVWFLFDSRRVSRGHRLRVTVVVWILLGTAFAYGTLRRTEIAGRMTASPKQVRVLVVQPHFSEAERRDAARRLDGIAERRVKALIGLTEKGLKTSPKPDWILWPETAIQNPYLEPASEDEGRAVDALEDWLHRTGVPLVFGAHERNDHGLYNSLHVFRPVRTAEGLADVSIDLYRKSLLFPLGERVPAGLPEWVKELFPGAGEFEAGPGPRVLRLPVGKGEVSVNPILCYEVAFPDFVQKGALLGSEMILNATNLGWFENPFAAHYHFMAARFRSIENRLPQVVASESGLSGVILPDGSVTKITAHGVADVFLATIPLIESPPTLVKRWGPHWLGYLCFGWLVLALGWQGLRRAR